MLAKPTGTLFVVVTCARRVCDFFQFNIIVTGNNPKPSSFSFTGGSGSQLVTLGPGSFKITESIPPNSFSLLNFEVDGDCMGSQTSPTQAQATGTISAGQHLICVLRNFVR